MLAMTMEDCYRVGMEQIPKIQELDDWEYLRNNICDFNDLTAKDFIKNYFDIREKCSLRNSIRGFEGKDIFKKDTHIVSVFLLGMYMSDFLVGKDGVTSEDFELIWFLASLYHDIVSDDDDCNILDGNINKSSMTYYDVDSILDRYDSENHYSVYSQSTYNMTYNKNLVETYYNCCLEGVSRKSKVDHGIVAGLVLYSLLCKNLDIKLQSGNSVRDFKESDKELYAKAADAVIAHNIWHIKLSDRYEWERSAGRRFKELKSICVGSQNHNRLSLGVNKYAFLLGVVDTVEPTKFFKEIPVEKLKNQIYFRKDKKNNSLYISYEGYESDLEDWYNKRLKCMEDWLRVNLEMSEKEISIKFL